MSGKKLAPGFYMVNVTCVGSFEVKEGDDTNELDLIDECRKHGDGEMSSVELLNPEGL